jgi:hypothetical protein
MPFVAQPWKCAWDVGRYVDKIVITGASASFTYLVNNEVTKARNTRFQLFCAASAIVGSIVPFTICSSYPFNEAIHDRLGEINGSSKQPEGAKDLKDLVIEWGRLDYYRSLLAFAGTAVGVSGFLV